MMIESYGLFSRIRNESDADLDLKLSPPRIKKKKEDSSTRGMIWFFYAPCLSHFKGRVVDS